MTLEEWRAVTPYIILFVTGSGALVAGVIGFLLKRAYDSIKDDIKQGGQKQEVQTTELENKIIRVGQKLEDHSSELEDKIVQVERDFMNFKIDLPKSFVLRSDHFRNMSILENKIDEHGRDIKDMVQKLGRNEATLQKLCGQIEARDDDH